MLLLGILFELRFSVLQDREFLEDGTAWLLRLSVLCVFSIGLPLDGSIFDDSFFTGL